MGDLHADGDFRSYTVVAASRWARGGGIVAPCDCGMRDFRFRVIFYSSQNGPDWGLCEAFECGLLCGRAGHDNKRHWKSGIAGYVASKTTRPREGQPEDSDASTQDAVCIIRGEWMYMWLLV